MPPANAFSFPHLYHVWVRIWTPMTFNHNMIWILFWICCKHVYEMIDLLFRRKYHENKVTSTLTNMDVLRSEFIQHHMCFGTCVLCPRSEYTAVVKGEQWLQTVGIRVIDKHVATGGTRRLEYRRFCAYLWGTRWNRRSEVYDWRVVGGTKNTQNEMQDWDG